MDSADAVMEFRTWRSERSQKSAMQLLLSLWTLTEDSGAADATVVSVEDVNAQFDTSLEGPNKQQQAIGLRSIGCHSTLQRKSQNGGASSANASMTSQQLQQEGAAVDPATADDEVLVCRQGLVAAPEDIEPIVNDNEVHFKVYCVLKSVGFDDHKTSVPSSGPKRWLLCKCLRSCARMRWRSSIAESRKPTQFRSCHSGCLRSW